MRFNYVIPFVLLIAGCQTARVGQPVVEKLGANGGDAIASNMEFWHTLNDQPLASNDDAFHALLLYFDGKDDAGTYATRLQKLKSRGWVASNFDEGPNRAVERGIVAQALVKAMNLKGGLTMRLIGSSPRYALRELQFRGLIPDASTGPWTGIA